MDHMLVPGIEIGGICVLYCDSVFIYWYSLISMNDTNVLNLVLFYNFDLSNLEMCIYLIRFYHNVYTNSNKWIFLLFYKNEVCVALVRYWMTCALKKVTTRYTVTAVPQTY
eukprot:SAG11_NODE_14730_length_591_cov_4.316733_1_plen_111_part_00